MRDYMYGKAQSTREQFGEAEAEKLMEIIKEKLGKIADSGYYYLDITSLPNVENHAFSRNVRKSLSEKLQKEGIKLRITEGARDEVIYYIDIEMDIRDKEAEKHGNN